MSKASKTQRFAPICAALMAITYVSSARAEDATPGLYLGLGAGTTHPEKFQQPQTSPNGLTSGFASFDTGFNIAGAVGYRWNNHLRTELEYSYRQATLDHLNGVTAQGHSDASGLMGNVLYDFNVASSFTPYVGGGIGVANVEWSHVHDPSFNNVARLRDSGLQWQLIGGVEKQVNPRLSLFAEYRYIGVNDLRFRNLGFAPVTAPTGQYDDRSHNFLVGVRWHPGASEVSSRQAY